MRPVFVPDPNIEHLRATVLCGSCAILLCVALALVGGCDEGSVGPRLDDSSPSPTTTQQAKLVTLTGDGFGAYEPGRSMIFVDGQCADPWSWDETRVTFLVPRGIGVGSKVVALHRGDGARARTTLDIIGPDLPGPASQVCDGGRPAVETRPPDAVVFDTWDGFIEDTRDVPPPPDTWVDTRDTRDVPPDVPFDTGPPPWQYQYVLIEDLSGNSIGRNPGVDLDAVVLRKANGDQIFAADVWFYEVGPNPVEALDPTELLGLPDAFPNYPDLSFCDVRNGTVSLGGGGLIVVSLPEIIEPGDVLDIYEVGDCEYAPGLDAIAELYMVSISVRPELDGPWLELGDGVGPRSSFDIPELPVGP